MMQLARKISILLLEMCWANLPLTLLYICVPTAGVKFRKSFLSAHILCIKKKKKQQNKTPSLALSISPSIQGSEGWPLLSLAQEKKYIFYSYSLKGNS